MVTRLAERIELTEVIDTLHGESGEIIAEYGTTAGEYGRLGVYAEYSPEVSKVLRQPGVFEYPRGREFLAYRIHEDRARKYLASKKFGAFVSALGVSHHDNESAGNGVMRVTTFPEGDYLNAFLDDHDAIDNGLRFYRPETPGGRADGVEFIHNLAEKRVAFAGLGQHWHSHDLWGHAFGYMLIEKRLAEKISDTSSTITEAGIERNKWGETEYGSPARYLGMAVDELTSALGNPGFWGKRRYDKPTIANITRLSGAIMMDGRIYPDSPGLKRHGVTVAVRQLRHAQAVLKAAA